mmetsp:Transcript_7886/g.15847  ORF Transcript_7886/g.15847 Transcript_7886/m.15847 type:complete len:103 (-) Transcript_7886:2235-2543(-)
MEAEVITVSAADREVNWLSYLLHSVMLQNVARIPLIIWHNDVAILLARGDKISNRAEYISIKYMHVGDEISQGKLGISHIGATVILADILTKLEHIPFEFIT